MNEKVKYLFEITGCGLLNCKKALEVCGGDIPVAYEFLRLKSQPVVRYKQIGSEKIRWSEQDYINRAKEICACNSVVE